MCGHVKRRVEKMALLKQLCLALLLRPSSFGATTLTSLLKFATQVVVESGRERLGR